jgi:hypothetical protein
MRGAIPPSPNTTSWHGAQKHRDNFIFTCNYTSVSLLRLQIKLRKMNENDSPVHLLLELVCMSHIEIFWLVTPCRVAVEYQSFRWPCCLHLQGAYSSNSKPPNQWACSPSSDGGSNVLWNIDLLPLQYTASHNSENLDLHLHYHENLKSSISMGVY